MARRRLTKSDRFERMFQRLDGLSNRRQRFVPGEIAVQYPLGRSGRHFVVGTPLEGIPSTEVALTRHFVEVTLRRCQQLGGSC